MNVGKQRCEYLDGAINMHPDEKSEQLVSAVSARDGDLNVLDIGPGGGVTLQGLADQKLDRGSIGLEGVNVSTLELFHSESEGLRTATYDLQRQGANVTHVTGDAMALPFRDESLDIVHASAVFHEIYSYAGGRDALLQALQEIDRVTAEGGALLYRDVYPIDQSLQVPVEQRYPRGSWEQFVRKFLPHYLGQGQHVYDSDDVSLTGMNGTYGGSMPAGLAREVQRHYITFRDSIIRNGMLGVKIDSTLYDETEWVRSPRGFEKKIYLANGEELLVGDEFAVQEDHIGIYAAASDFDQYVDEQLIGFFEELDMNRPNEVAAFTDWLGREGVESYVYGSVSDITDLIRTGGRPSEGEERFAITDAAHYTVSERDYYTDYLHAALGQCAMPDKKLMITFEKTS